jgi:hypothetical protein
MTQKLTSKIYKMLFQKTNKENEFENKRKGSYLYEPLKYDCAGGGT